MAKYSPCDLTVDVPGAPTDRPLDLRGEFRSPKLVTTAAQAFWDGGSKWVLRFTPAEEGTYAWRLSGSAGNFAGRQGTLTIGPAERSGWLRAANLHHFAFVEGINLTPHLWTGAVVKDFASTDAARWKSLVDTRASQGFNHLAITLVDSSSADRFRTPEFFQQAEEKIRAANARGIIVDIAFFSGDGLMDRLLPSRAERERWFTWALQRLAPFDVTWQGIDGWEKYANGRGLLKEIAGS